MKYNVIQNSLLYKTSLSNIWVYRNKLTMHINISLSKTWITPKNHSQENTTLILSIALLFGCHHTINVGGTQKLATTYAIYTSITIIH
jgi:hypothetical protein